MTKINPDLLSSFLIKTLYRDGTVDHWPEAEVARVEMLTNGLRTQFGFSELGFIDASIQQIELVYQCIQEILLAPTSEDLHCDVVMPADDTPVVQFTEKILLDQGPLLLDFTRCSKDERCQFLIDALRHRLELPSFRDLPQAAAPTAQTNAPSSVFRANWRNQFQHVSITND